MIKEIVNKLLNIKRHEDLNHFHIACFVPVSGKCLLCDRYDNWKK